MDRGLSDDELESLASRPRREYGFAPWARFECERTGYGREFRRRALYPGVLPLFFNCDHYVDTQSGLRESEVERGTDNYGYATYLTWNKTKYQLLDSLETLHPYFVEHPWLTSKARKICIESRSRSRTKGCLFFFPHSRPGKRVKLNLELLADELNILASMAGPVTICVSSHDINLGIHRELRLLGFPLVTAGDICSQKFIDRFYRLILDYSLTAGTGLATHAFYILEAGIPYRIVGGLDEWVQDDEGGGSKAYLYSLAEEEHLDQGEVALRARVETILNASRPNETVHPLVRSYVDRYMGKDSTITRKDFIMLVWRQFFRNWRSLPDLYLRGSTRPSGWL